jgi:hypothetical protein
VDWVFPAEFWTLPKVSFGAIVESFFRRKCSRSLRFVHKLHAALVIATTFPGSARYLGVEWVGPDADGLVRVDTVVFCRLVGIASAQKALFHRQRNFATHGFEDRSRDFSQ